MARHLSSIDVMAIVNVVHGMEASSLTWELICEKVAPSVGKRPTRQSLCKHAAIVSAYKFCKGKHRTLQPTAANPSSLSVAAQRIRRLESEIDELKKSNRLLHYQLVTIQYNVHTHGMTLIEAEKPMPPIDRERTDDN